MSRYLLICLFFSLTCCLLRSMFNVYILNDVSSFLL
jgi:hypothetical protein